MYLCAVSECMCAYICAWCVCVSLCVQELAWHSRSDLLVSNSERLQFPIWQTAFVIFPWQFILFLFVCFLLPLYNCDWGREPECPVTHGQEVEVGHYKQSPLHTNVLHLTLCFYWSLSLLCLQLHPLIPSPVPIPCPVNFPPPLSPSPLPTPSFLCLLLLPWFTFSANIYPFFVKLLSLTFFTVSASLKKRRWGG